MARKNQNAVPTPAMFAGKKKKPTAKRTRREFGETFTKNPTTHLQYRPFEGLGAMLANKRVQS